jgi:hypothetical protein
VGVRHDLLAQELETGNSGALASLVGVGMSEICNEKIATLTSGGCLYCNAMKGHEGPHTHTYQLDMASLNNSFIAALLASLDDKVATLQLQVTDLHSKVDALHTWARLQGAPQQRAGKGKRGK